MKQSLQLKLGQQLTMTPQLQQAIRLLQLSTLDLQQEIQEALDTNPLLEVTEDGDNESSLDERPNERTLDEHTLDDSNHSDANGADEFSADGPMQDMEKTATDEPGETNEWDSQQSKEVMPDELPVDTQWEDLLPSSSAPSSAGEDFTDGDSDSRNPASESLREQLLWQLNLTRLSDVDRLIAISIIDATDGNGRLLVSVDEIYDSLSPHLDIDPDEVVAVLHRLQQFEPAGVCTGSLQECLLVQLEQLPAATEWLEQAKTVIGRHINQLATSDFAQIMRRTRLKENELMEVLALVQTLDPNPGQTAVPDEIEYVVPDIFVTKSKGRWLVELNPDIAPKLRINSEYAGLIKRADTSADNTFLRDNLQEARWFLKSLHSRNETLMKVATKIVEHQRNFLEYGEEAMKPLVLHDIAEAVEMHESTISRATTNKFMHTPRGIFELKYFFSSHVATAAGGECSSTAIRALIKKLVAAENPRKPLSDNKITQILEDQGIKVARRTIAKYRDTLFIPPSNERKRLV